MFVSKSLQFIQSLILLYFGVFCVGLIAFAVIFFGLSVPVQMIAWRTV